MLDRLNRLKNQDVKKINVIDQVQTSFLSDDSKFPLVISPVNSGYNLNNWISENKPQFESDLQKYGAILFRNFKINTVERFQQLMAEFPKELLEYKFRSSPRFELANNVYVSTTYPEDETINMHSENSYAPEHPGRIVFCCITPALVQGETPIADNRLVLDNLSDSLRHKFLEKGVQYRRNLSGVLGLPWQEVFQSSDKEYVEEECKRNGMTFTWVNEEQLVLTWNKKAIWEHPQTKELVWFNHSLFFNKCMLHEDVIKSVSSENELPNNTYFGDGTEISEAEIEEIKTAYHKATVAFPWEKGDVLFLDNMLFSHGRNPYKGERKIIVSIS